MKSSFGFDEQVLGTLSHLADLTVVLFHIFKIKLYSMAMKSELTRRKLVEMLVFTAELEKKLETIKQMLAEQPDFTPASLFYRFDSKRKGYIDQRDVEDFLADSNIEHTGLELKVLFGRMDENLDGRISMREFQDFILPAQNSKLRYETVRRQVIIPLPHQKLDMKVQWIAIKFFTEIIKEYTRLKEYNTTLVSSFDFDHKSVFKMLSKNGESITYQGLQDFFAENDCILNTEELGCLVKLLDRHGDGDIKPDDMKKYLATLNIKKQSEILDELSPIPTIKIDKSKDKSKGAEKGGQKGGSEKKVTFSLNRNEALLERYWDNQHYKETLAREIQEKSQSKKKHRGVSAKSGKKKQRR